MSRAKPSIFPISSFAYPQPRCSSTRVRPLSAIFVLVYASDGTNHDARERTWPRLTKCTWGRIQVEFVECPVKLKLCLVDLYRYSPMTDRWSITRMYALLMSVQHTRTRISRVVTRPIYPDPVELRCSHYSFSFHPAFAILQCRYSWTTWLTSSLGYTLSWLVKDIIRNQADSYQDPSLNHEQGSRQCDSRKKKTLGLLEYGT